MTGSFSKKSFFNIIFICYKFFWTFLSMFSWNLNAFTKHKEQVSFLFICSFFTCCFIIILYVYALHLFILFCCMWTYTMSLFSFFIVVLQSLYVLSNFCAGTGSLKRAPLSCKFSWWSLNFLKTRLNSAEIGMSKLSKV